MFSEYMKPAERFAAYIAGKPVDRAPVIEWAPWWGLTIDRRRTEGLPDSAGSVGEIQAYFTSAGYFTNPITDLFR